MAANYMLAVKSLLKDNDNMLLDEYQIAEQIISSKRFSKNEELFILAKSLKCFMFINPLLSGSYELNSFSISVL